MTKETQAAFEAVRDQIADRGAKLARLDYEDLIAELSAHIQCLMDCIEDEKPEAT